MMPPHDKVSTTMDSTATETGTQLSALATPIPADLGNMNGTTTMNGKIADGAGAGGNNNNLQPMGRFANKAKPSTLGPSPPPFMMMTPGMANGDSAAYHPDFMFCGSCTTCQPAEDGMKSHAVDENLDDYLLQEVHSDDSDDGGVAAHRTSLQITSFPSNSSAPSSHGLLFQSLLKPLAGVESVAVEKEASKVFVVIHHTLQTSQAQLVAALKRGGYKSVVVKDEQSADATPTSLHRIEDGMNDSSKSHNSYTSQIVRSQFHVGGICCAMEIPAIRKIVKPLLGVETLQINITTKMVYVQHDSNLIEAEAIASCLGSEGFPSEIIVDGGAVNKQRLAAASAVTQKVGENNNGRTTLHIRGRLLQDQDEEVLQQQLSQLPGVSQVEIHVRENLIIVEHSMEVESISIPSQVKGDLVLEVVQTAQEEQQTDSLFQASSRSTKSNYVESTLVISHLQHRNVPTLQNIFRQNHIKSNVRAFFPHVPSQTIKVEHNPDFLSAEDIAKILEPYGLKAYVAVDGKEAGLVLPMIEDYGYQHGSDAMEDEEDAASSLKCPVILSGLFWVLSMVSAFGAEGVWHYFQYFGLLSVFFGLPPVARKAWRTIRRRQFDSNCMMVTAALGALVLQEYDEAASVAFLFSVSEFLEARSTSKARIALKAIVQLRPEHAAVIHPTTKAITIVPASQVPVGSWISVRTGDKIAADGIVIEGVSTVDESSLTGESRPIMKRANDQVSGGTINVGTTHLIVKTTCSVEDSVVSRLIKVVEDAQSSRSLTEKMIDRFAKSYTPLVVCMAAIMCTVPWIFGSEIGHYWTLNGLIIIVIACPCSLTISTPVTYAAGLAATAQKGIIVKGGAHLEALGGVSTVVLDKTGTLTHGQFHVDHINEIGNVRTRKEMLELLALMEAPSTHPLSETLVRAARKEGVSIPKDAEVKLHTILKGEGVTAKVNGKQVYVGNKRLFDRIGMFKDLSAENQKLASEWEGNGATVGFIGVEKEGIIGSFSMVDTIREEAKDTIQGLQNGNIQVMMLTGDGEGAANAVARQVGIPSSAVFSQLLPEDKLHHVGSLIRPDPSRCGPCKSNSKVLFIGDGINDTPALAVADVGVSMGDGAAALAMEVSDVTLMDSNLSKLVYVINKGKRVVTTIQENIAISLLSKLLVVALTFAGKMTLFGAIASDVGVMLLVTLNGMKLLPVSTDIDPKAKRRILSPRGYNEVTNEDVADADSDFELSYFGKQDGIAEIV